MIRQVLSCHNDASGRSSPFRPVVRQLFVITPIDELVCTFLYRVHSIIVLPVDMSQFSVGDMECWSSFFILLLLS